VFRIRTFFASGTLVSRALTNCLLGCLLPAVLLARANEPPFRRVTAPEVRQVVIGELRSLAMEDDQFPHEEDVELPLAVPIRAGSALHASSVCWDSDARSARFRLECGRAGDCLPFLAYVRMSSNPKAPSCRPESVPQASRLSAEPSLRAGKSVTAILSAAGIRMTAPVTCLERGSAGDIIRVRGHEGRIFRARIVGQGLVEAILK
jgi:hypothetical protein